MAIYVYSSFLSPVQQFVYIPWLLPWKHLQEEWLVGYSTAAILLQYSWYSKYTVLCNYNCFEITYQSTWSLYSGYCTQASTNSYTDLFHQHRIQIISLQTIQVFLLFNAHTCTMSSHTAICTTNGGCSFVMYCVVRRTKFPGFGSTLICRLSMVVRSGPGALSTMTV